VIEQLAAGSDAELLAKLRELEVEFARVQFRQLSVLAELNARNVLNRPGMSGDSKPWKGWGHVREYVEEVPGRAA